MWLLRAVSSRQGNQTTVFLSEMLLFFQVKANGSMINVYGLEHFQDLMFEASQTIYTLLTLTGQNF